ncbi:hypothetical protein PRUPE_2G195200, partial [Prunus persica]
GCGAVGKGGSVRGCGLREEEEEVGGGWVGWGGVGCGVREGKGRSVRGCGEKRGGGGRVGVLGEGGGVERERERGDGVSDSKKTYM